jgi:hypothetical protein
MEAKAKELISSSRRVRMGRIGYHSKELPSVEHKERNGKNNGIA